MERRSSVNISSTNDSLLVYDIESDSRRRPVDFFSSILPNILYPVGAHGRI